MNGKKMNPALMVPCFHWEEVDHEGWMYKLGGSGLIPRNWRRRWFVLKDKKLYYYKTSFDISALGIVDLVGYKFESASDIKRKNSFKATRAGARTYCFQADTPEEMMRWIQILREASEPDGDHALPSLDTPASIEDRPKLKSSHLQPQQPLFRQIRGPVHTKPREYEPHDYDYPELDQEYTPTQPHEYDYPGLQQHEDPQYSYADAHLATPMSSMHLYDPVYEPPAKSEPSLYAQYQKFRIQEIPRNSLSISDHLGTGQFGTVYKAVWHSPSGPLDVAVKTLLPNASDEDKVKFLQEAAIAGQFHHPNVVALCGVVSKGEPKLIVLELLPNGDLRSRLKSLKSHRSAHFDDNLLTNYCQDVALGMQYLSAKRFIHRDLAARNILLSSKNVCKIGDFGLSRDLADEKYYISGGGKIPVRWTAPEALLYKKYSTASDVWAYGVLMYEVWSLGLNPYEGYTNDEVVQLVSSSFRLPPPPRCPRAIYQLMIECWHPDRSKRPSFHTIVEALSRPHIRGDGTQKLRADLQAITDVHKDLQGAYAAICDPPPAALLSKLKSKGKKAEAKKAVGKPTEQHGYETLQQYESLGKYESPSTYEAAGKYDKVGMYETTQQYGAVQQYEAVQRYGTVQQYEATQQYETVQQYESTQQYGTVQKYEAIQQYQAVDPYERMQNYERVGQYEAVSPYELLKDNRKDSPNDEDAAEETMISTSSKSSKDCPTKVSGSIANAVSASTGSSGGADDLMRKLSMRRMKIEQQIASTSKSISGSTHSSLLQEN